MCIAFIALAFAIGGYLGLWAGKRQGQRAGLQKAWDAINGWVKPGPLQGNGCDQQAQRNGMVLASNIVFGLIHPTP